VLGTLVIQGLTLKPLLRRLELQDGDPVGQELKAAREGALRAGLASFANEQSPGAKAIREMLNLRFSGRGGDTSDGAGADLERSEIRRGALHAARQAVIAMRDSGEIGDDAFHQMEEELDWVEMADGSGRG